MIKLAMNWLKTSVQETKEGTSKPYLSLSVEKEEVAILWECFDSMETYFEKENCDIDLIFKGLDQIRYIVNENEFINNCMGTNELMEFHKWCDKLEKKIKEARDKEVIFKKIEALEIELKELKTKAKAI